jgi:hypothetical protein
MKNLTLLSIAYIIVIFLLFLYSYTQVDLSLTLSQISIYQVVEKLFQHIGYFQRPISTYVYVSIVFLLFIFYGIFLHISRKDALPTKYLWRMLIAITIILSFSYNAFSYDLFNYIFDAKIVTHYHQNPYLYKALDFPKDPMLSFMHSTHRVFPYGPIWLILTIPLSFVGGNIFLITFYLFKLLSGAAYIGIAYFIKKILLALKVKNSSFGIIFFALNPLTIIEGIVSGHNDIIMTFFAISALYFLLRKKYILSFFLLLLSIGIKYGSLLLLPIFFLSTFVKKITVQTILVASFFLMILSVIFISFAFGQNKNSEIQPWYWLNVLPFAGLIPEQNILTFLIYFLSLGMLTIYIPFLFNGTWPMDIVLLKIYILVISLIVGTAAYFLNRFVKA